MTEDFDQDAKKPRSAAELREEAEAAVGEAGFAPTPFEAADLSHELSVVQIELEMQNVELRRTNESLQAQVEKYFSLFDAAPVAYVLADRRGRIRDVNVRATLLLGRQRLNLRSQPLITFVARGDRGALMRHIGAVFEERAQQEVGLQLTDTLAVHVLARSTFLADVDDDGRCLMALTDVTELRRAEKLIEAARQEAVRTDRAKTQFVATLSHEIRTPLSSVVAYTDLVLAEHPDHPANERIERIARAAKHVTQLINDVLDISKIEADSIELNAHVFVPAELAEYVVELNHPKAHLKNLTFELDVDPSAETRLVGDAERLRQCVVNLVGNAVKFTPDGGTVRMQVAYRAGTLVTIVEDSGAGIPDDLKEAIFRPYKQVDGSDARAHGGVGLGLAITRKLAEALGGQVLASNSKLGGARFVMHVPFSPVEDDMTAPLAPPVSLRRSYRPGEPLLVVDDDPEIRGLMAAMLTHLGLPFDDASSGEEALEMLGGKPYSGVLLDMQMPELDGMEVARRIRLTPGLRDIPIAALTAKVMTHEVQACLSAGCDMHIAKPVRIETLREGLAALVGAREPATERRLSDVAGVAALRDAFLGRLDDKLDEMRADWAAGNIEQVCAEAHKLAGSSGMFGLPGLSGVARSLELAIEARGADAVAEFDTFVAEVGRLAADPPQR